MRGRRALIVRRGGGRRCAPVMRDLRGLTPGDVPAAAEALRARIGSMPAHMAQQVDKGVARALAAYGTIYRQHVS